MDSVLLCSWKINFCIHEDALKIYFFNALFFNNVQIIILIFSPAPFNFVWSRYGLWVDLQKRSIKKFFKIRIAGMSHVFQ